MERAHPSLSLYSVSDLTTAPSHPLSRLRGPQATLTTVFNVARGVGEEGVVMRHLVIGLKGLDLRLVAPPPVAPTVLTTPLVLSLEVRLTQAHNGNL